MASKTSEVSFAIRFKPSSHSADDDDDDDDVIPGNHPLACKPKKETVSFERQSVTPSSHGASCDSDVEQMLQSSQVQSDVSSTSLSDVSKSASTSEISSQPTHEMASGVNDKSLPIKASGSKDNVKDPAATPTVEKSLFSGLKEKLDRLSAESKEIFDRKMRRSGSADAAKITALLNGGDVTKIPDDGSKVVESRHTRSPSDGTSICSEHSQGSTTPVDLHTHDVTAAVAGGLSLMHKSASVGATHVTKNEDLPAMDSLAWNKRSSVATDYELATFKSSDKMSLSDLLSSCNDGLDDAKTKGASIASEGEPDLSENSSSGKACTAPSVKRQKLSFTATIHKWQNTIAVFVGLLAYLLIPLPTYMSGFVTGSLCTVMIMGAYLYLTKLKKTGDMPVKQTLMPSSVVSAEVKDTSKPKRFETKFKGWMNELSRYDVDDYHINQTSSIFVTLEGTTLRLQTPKHGVAKRAIVDETIPPVTFVRQRHFDLYGGRVYLLPSDLVSKRLWSKKYPICIEPSKPSRNRSLDLCIKDSDHMKLKSAEWSSFSDGSLKRNGDLADDGRHQPALYLFARTCREKEEWYRRFVAAARGTPWPTRISDVTALATPPRSTSPERQTPNSIVRSPKMKHHRTDSTDSTGSSPTVEFVSSPGVEIDYGMLSPEQNLSEYLKYMAKIMLPCSPDTPVSIDADAAESDSSEPTLVWLNALIGRSFFDFLREKYWAEKMREKIQKKLCKMHVPHFIEKLSVTGIELGSSVPSVCRVHPPFLDDRGLWIDLDITYSGGFCISMATKCNLMKLKQSTVSTNDIQDVAAKEKRSAITHSDEEDSAESTTDEENVEDNSAFDPTEDKRSEPMGKKLLRFVDKISQSRYFQQATEYKYIKKAMEEVSNTRLVLNVEMCSINGTLSVNIPPPPSDRIWYGFRGNPNLVLSAKPCVGEREVNLSPITDWIEKKLAVEFQRVFVIPNMDDIPIPLMCPHLG